MFQVNRVFHLTHLVEDHDATLRWYADVFGAQTYWEKSTGPGNVTISLLHIGDLTVSPMTVTEGGAPAPAKFRERFGEHLHSIAWHIEDAADLVEHLTGQGYTLKDEFGRPLDGIDHEIWTSVKETPCLIEMCGLHMASLHKDDPRFDDPTWVDRWADERPLGIERTACITVTSNDRAAGTAFFTDGLKGKVLHEGPTPWGTASTFVQVGDFTTVELAEPTDPAGRAAADLDRNGPMVHAMTFQVRDLEAARSHLSARGLRLESPAEGHLAIDPADAHGLVVRFTDRPVGAW
ncbi:MAG: VOC family protein [Acidimicrobiia bacterium]